MSQWLVVVVVVVAVAFLAFDAAPVARAQMQNSASAAEDRDREEAAVYRSEKELLWCCLTGEELAKCRAFARATQRDQERSDYTFGSYYRPIK